MSESVNKSNIKNNNNISITIISKNKNKNNSANKKGID